MAFPAVLTRRGALRRFSASLSGPCRSFINDSSGEHLVIQSHRMAFLQISADFQGAAGFVSCLSRTLSRVIDKAYDFVNIAGGTTNLGRRRGETLGKQSQTPAFA